MNRLYDLYCNPTLVAQHDYETVSSGDLSFNKDDKFQCLDTYVSWLRVKNCRTNEEGLVPREYLVPESSRNKEHREWYHENISRIEAEILLHETSPGTFLVRPTNLKHAFSLSIKSTSHVQPVVHYKIFKKRGFYYLSEEVKRKSMSDLISQYINKDSMGLVQTLLHPCPKLKPKIYDFCGKYRKNIEIERAEVTILENISSGNFGIVNKGLWRDRIIAIKQLLQFDHKTFMKEVEALKLLQHENVVTLFGVCTIDGPHLMLFQYAERGSLESHLKNVPIITSNIQLRFIQQISSGMTYVSQKNIVHRDLAARNILVTQDYKAIIADFGLSRVTPDGYYEAQRREAAYRWQALECFQNHFSTKSDVWAFGVLVVEIFTRCETPYSNLRTSADVKKYLEDGSRLDIPKEMPGKMYNKIKLCWRRKRKDRPSFRDLKAFFYEYE